MLTISSDGQLSSVILDDDTRRFLGYDEKCFCGVILSARPQRIRGSRYNVDEAVLRAWEFPRNVWDLGAFEPK